MHIEIRHRESHPWLYRIGLVLLAAGVIGLVVSFTIVSGASIGSVSVDATNRITFAVPNGSLKPVAGERQQYNLIELFPANNTFMFNVTGLETSQPRSSQASSALVYNLNTTGNVSFTFYDGIVQPKVVCQGCTIVQNSGGKTLLTYPTGKTNTPLVLVWLNRGVFGIVMGSGFFTMIIIAVALLYASSGISVTMQVIEKTGRLLDGSRRERKIQWDLGWLMVGFGAIVSYGFMLVFVAQIFGFACPTGFTCSG